MVSAKQVIRNTVRPSEGMMMVNRLINRFRGDTDYNTKGVDVMEEDWDTLIILDACRYDLFRDRYDLPGELRSKVSRGGGTVEFLRGNLRERSFPDTVYVSANPQIARLKDELNTEFHDVVSLWETKWDDDIQNVPPDRMTEAAIDALDTYPNKRLIFHYNQPHGPFLGPTASDLVIGPNRTQDESLFEFTWDQIQHNFISHDEWWDAYTETFDIVQEYIQDLLPEIDGRTVVTSDHGKLMGERGSPIPVKYYGHHIGVHDDPLVKIPWLVHETGSRREITEGSVTAIGESDERRVQEQLRDLGYV